MLSVLSTPRWAPAAMGMIDLPSWYPCVFPGHHGWRLSADRIPGSKCNGREQPCLAGRELITTPSFCQEPFLCCNSYFSTASLQKALGEARAMTPEITNQSLLYSLLFGRSFRAENRYQKYRIYPDFLLAVSFP